LLNKLNWRTKSAKISWNNLFTK